DVPILGAGKHELADDLLQPGRARLRVAGDDDVVVAELEVVPDRRIEVMIVQFAGLPRPGDRARLHAIPLQPIPFLLTRYDKLSQCREHHSPTYTPGGVTIWRTVTEVIRVGGKGRAAVLGRLGRRF